MDNVVYLVTYYDKYDDVFIVHIFSAREKAEAYIAEDGNEDVELIEWTLDESRRHISLPRYMP